MEFHQAPTVDTLHSIKLLIVLGMVVWDVCVLPIGLSLEERVLIADDCMTQLPSRYILFVLVSKDAVWFAEFILVLKNITHNVGNFGVTSSLI